MGGVSRRPQPQTPPSSIGKWGPSGINIFGGGNAKPPGDPLPSPPRPQLLISDYRLPILLIMRSIPPIRDF